MNLLLRSLGCVLLTSAVMQAQQGWPPPVAITQDTINEQYPALVNLPFEYFFSHPNEEFLAVVRNGRQICVRQTESNGTRWSDSMYCVPNDSAQFSQPTLTYTRIPGTSRHMVVLVWVANEYPLPNSNLMYTTRSDAVWNQPALLTTQSAGDRNPHIAPHDSGVGVVWERGGRIMYSRYAAGNWSTPEFVTPPGDTLNCKPQLYYERGWPVVLWHKRKAPDTTFALFVSTKRGGAWKTPDTLAFTGDNRDAKFFVPNIQWGSFGICWSRSTTTGWEAVASLSFYSSTDSLRRGIIEPLSPYQREGINILPSVNDTPLPVTTPTTNFIWYLVGAWQSYSIPEGPGIAATLWGGSNYTLFTGPNASTFRNPVVSAGSFNYPYLRIWIVWEGMENNRWKLYGSYATFIVTDIPERNIPPEQFALYQNYPNPFNPVTTIRFRIQASGFVSLRVYDVLGREVATLVNEVQAPGFKSVEFDGSDLPSGVYFYRLKVGSHVQCRKMMLIR